MTEAGMAASCAAAVTNPSSASFKLGILLQRVPVKTKNFPSFPGRTSLLAALLASALVMGCGGGSSAETEATPLSFTLSKVGGFGSTLLGASEITAFDS